MSESQGPISVYDVVAIMAEQMASIAWQKLGLHPDPITNTIAADLGEAKVAIDVVTYLSEQMESKLDEEDRRELHNLVRNLRLNYVEKSRSLTS